jgi:hypothetical protein
MNQVQALLAAQGQMGMGGMGQMNQMNQMGQIQQMAQPQQQQQQQLGGGGQINMAAFQQLLNSGQMVSSSRFRSERSAELTKCTNLQTREQFNLLAQQIQQQQMLKQQAAAVNAQNQNQNQNQPQNIPQNRPPSQPSYPSHSAPPAQQQNEQQRIPLQFLQNHMQQLNAVRSLNSKLQLLSQALQTGMISTAAAGLPNQGQDSQIPLNPQSRQAVERQVEEAK